MKELIAGATGYSLAGTTIAAIGAFLTPNAPYESVGVRYGIAAVDQLLHQDWHLFSPNPGYEHFELWFLCSGSGDSVRQSLYGSLLSHSRELRISPETKWLGYLSSQVSMSLDVIGKKTKRCEGTPGKEVLCDASMFSDEPDMEIMFSYVSRKCKKRDPSSQLSELQFIAASPFDYSKADLIGSRPFGKLRMFRITGIQKKELGGSNGY